MPEPRRARGMVDTSVLIDPPPETAMPEEASIAAITLAELVAGVHATRNPNERAARQDRLQRAITGAGRKARGKRAIDLLIAATALSVGLPLYTRNINDFSGLEGVVDIVEVRA